MIAGRSGYVGKVVSPDCPARRFISVGVLAIRIASVTACVYLHVDVDTGSCRHIPPCDRLLAVGQMVPEARLHWHIERAGAFYVVSRVTTTCVVVGFRVSEQLPEPAVEVEDGHGEINVFEKVSRMLEDRKSLHTYCERTAYLYMHLMPAPVTRYPLERKVGKIAASRQVPKGG